jgi:hypothetical protein
MANIPIGEHKKKRKRKIWSSSLCMGSIFSFQLSIAGFKFFSFKIVHGHSQEGSQENSIQ